MSCELTVTACLFESQTTAAFKSNSVLFFFLRFKRMTTEIENDIKCIASQEVCTMQWEKSSEWAKILFLVQFNFPAFTSTVLAVVAAGKDLKCRIPKFLFACLLAFGVPVFPSWSCSDSRHVSLSDVTTKPHCEQSSLGEVQMCRRLCP